MDVKDRKLLYELSKNSRLSAPQIAKNVGLSKDAVIYRMKHLEHSGVIQKYVAVVNLKKLHYRTHIVFLEFRKFDLLTEKKVLSFLVDFPYSIWVASPSGHWDVIVDIISKSTDQFDEILSTLIDQLGDNLKHYDVLETVREFYYNHKYLTGENVTESSSPNVHYSLDHTDYLILKSLSQNSRVKSTDISKKIHVSHDQVSYRIKKLAQSKIIEQFTVWLDVSKLNHSYYYLFLKLNSLNKKTENRITSFLKSQKEVLFFGKTAGRFNFNIDVIVEDQLQLKLFINHLREHFGDILESRENLLMFDQRKNNYFPEGILKDLA
ncbi:AsnC family transcriptional regulator [Candidatus Woesearchaeota archaeon]|nr:AsnC family transcriptional regulator [Candidatus Woesearchaeota archaeon]